VDDLISGAKSKEDAVIIVDQASKLLAKGKFELRKWCLNVSAVLDGVADKDKESCLGLAWDPVSDQLLFMVTVGFILVLLIQPEC